MAKIFTDENFETEAMQAALPVVIDFYADWCGPCKMMAPIIEELARQYEGKVIIGKLNVDESPNTASKFGIMSIPTLCFLKKGIVVDKVIGALPKDVLVKKLESL